jgi:RNA polymerase sigma-70 factor (ECF subfamily)
MVVELPGANPVLFRWRHMGDQSNSPDDGRREQAPTHTPDANELVALAYDELRALAADYLKRERPEHTLQPTALVHEAYLRLVEFKRIQWKDKTHFCSAAAGVIRRLLVDFARARATAKRGGGWNRLTLTGLDGTDSEPAMDLLALDEALSELAALDERKCLVVEMRYFGGMTIEETARALDVGTTTVEDDWVFARSWLRRELGDDES